MKLNFKFLPYLTLICLYGLCVSGQSSASNLVKKEEYEEQQPTESFLHTSARIDLHGMSLEKAKTYTRNTIQALHARQLAHSVHIITGRGKHKNARGERGAIFKQFPEWLKGDSISNLITKVDTTEGAYEVYFTHSVAQEEDQPNSADSSRINDLKELADRGMPWAQYCLGKCYADGENVKKDNKAAVKWLTKAASQDFADAQHALGVMCTLGKGIKYSQEDALKWFEKSADQGFGISCHNIATIFLQGKEHERDYRKAAQWHLRGAHLNHAPSQTQLGIFYRKGWGVEQNDQEAVKWDRRAAELGEPHAKVNLGCMLISGRGVEKNAEEGFKWLKEGAEEGLIDGQFWLATAYEKGQGTGIDYREALRWYLTVALRKGHPGICEAQFALYKLYKEGKGVKKNWDLAQDYLSMAVDNGHLKAHVILARYYRLHSLDYKKALELYNYAADRGDPEAQYCLFEMYDLGIGIPQDKALAHKWLMHSAHGGYTMALLFFGIVTKEAQLIMGTSKNP